MLRRSDETTEFLKQQLAESERTLNDQDAKLADFKREYFGKLPTDEGTNINILASLNTQLEAATESITNMEQNKSYMEAMLAQQVNTPVGSTSAAKTPAKQEKDLEALETQEADLLTRYQPDYPDVKSVRRKIADLKAQMAESASVAAAPTPAPPSGVPRIDSATAQDLRAKLRALDLAINTKRANQAQIEKQVANYQARVQSSPEVEERYGELTRGYQTALSFHDNLLAKINQSKMATDLEHRQQGEQFRVMDEPNLPDSPFYPKRQVFLFGGLGAGFALGLAIVGLLEYKDTAMRTERDIWAFTQLPTLAVIAWSGDVAHVKIGKWARLKLLITRKPPKDELADVPV